MVIDVGANVGEYALTLRSHGYHGRIISCEPLPTAFRRLSTRAASDPGWDALPIALGEEPGSLSLNVAGNLASSSFLPMLDRHSRAEPNSAYVSALPVEVRRLDVVVAPYLDPASRPFLKIDVQGYEDRVLRGAGSLLDRFVGIQLEMSLVPLYANAPSMCALVDTLAQHGFALAAVEPGFEDHATGRLLQIDGLFVRADLT